MTTVKTGYKDLERSSWMEISEYFTLVKLAGTKSSRVYLGLPKLDYNLREKMKLETILKMDSLEISRSSVFVECGFLQHARSAWRENCALGRHKDVIWEGASLNVGAAFAYCECLAQEVRPLGYHDG